MSLIIKKPGILSTIQDSGRRGYQKYGVIVNGAMDSFAMRAANLLVGNESNEAVIEATIVGPTVYFDSFSLIAICGGDFQPTIDGVKVPMWQPHIVKAGSTLKIGSACLGIRCYLAICGGFKLPFEMESRSTYLRAGFGGFSGRALRAGDFLETRKKSTISKAILSTIRSNENRSFYSIPCFISHHVKPLYSKNPLIRVIKGAHFELFTTQSKILFFKSSYKVLASSDRMGYRLKGAELGLKKSREIISEAVSFGTIQVPPDGQPIVLMADHQTIGGYPRIAEVISVDLPLMAQLNLGSSVHFQEISLHEAQKLYIKREQDLRLMEIGMKDILKKFGGS